MPQIVFIDRHTWKACSRPCKKVNSIMTNLQYIASFSFEVILSKCKAGKEGLDQSIMEIIKHLEKKGLYPIRWNRKMNSKGDIVLEYEGNPFANLSFKDCFVIGDNLISFTYEERTDQQVMLPNIYSYVYMLLVAIKVAKTLNGDFDKHSITCSVRIENNTDCYFYEKFSPLVVDYSRMLKYRLGKNVSFEFEVEKEEDVYMLVNRIYRQYMSDESVEKPYVTVIREHFNQLYDEF